MSIPKLAIVSTHPIQYNAPFFRKIAESGNVDLMVFYTLGKGDEALYDPGFKKTIAWDVPLLEGYNYKMLRNISKTPNSYHHSGVICPDLITELETFGPNAILFYGWNFHAHLKAMKYFKGKTPVWFRGDSTLLDYDYKWLGDLFESVKRSNRNIKKYALALRSYFRFKVRKLYLTHIYKKIDLAFHVGANNKAYYTMHKLKEHQLIIMPHAVNLDFFQSQHEERELEALAWRRDLGIADKDFVFLYAGKFDFVKNPQLLIKAFKKVRKDNSLQNIHLIMVGNGKLEAELKNLAENFSFIHFLPFQNQSKMPLVYRLGNVYCLSSRSETWGLAVNEALSCGRPVIASDKVGGAIDLIQDGVNGFIFKSGDLEQLSEKIYLSYETFVHVNNRAIQMDVAKKFNLEKNVEIIANTLARLSN